LPLAIRIAGTRLAARPHWPVARLVDRLSDTRRRLDELAVDDLAVRASLALSYDGLPSAARRALRLLAHYDPPDFGGWLLAPLLDVAPADAEDLLDRLVEAQLVDTTGAGRRYVLHDLVALYARERA